MNLGGRWIPIDLANTLLLTWVISTVVFGAIVYWLTTRKPPPPDRKRVRVRRGRGKRRAWRFRR